MRIGLLVGVGAGAITTYALMSRGGMIERNLRKQGKKLMKKIQDLVD